MVKILISKRKKVFCCHNDPSGTGRSCWVPVMMLKRPWTWADYAEMGPRPSVYPLRQSPSSLRRMSARSTCPPIYLMKSPRQRFGERGLEKGERCGRSEQRCTTLPPHASKSRVNRPFRSIYNHVKALELQDVSCHRSPPRPMRKARESVDISRT